MNIKYIQMTESSKELYGVRTCTLVPVYTARTGSSYPTGKDARQ